MADTAALKEQGHFFDFTEFYRKVEFSDRQIQLEILDDTSADQVRQADVTIDRDDVILVSAVILAAKSRVLRTMLSNGMRESDASTPVRIKVTAEEGAAFKEMIRFMYVGSLSPRLTDAAACARAPSDAAAQASELVELLKVGDKFDVPSLIGAVVKTSQKRRSSMSLQEFVVFASQVPDLLQDVSLIQDLVNSARAGVLNGFRDVSKKWGSIDFLNLDTELVEILLQSDAIEMDSEEEVFRAVLAWIRHNVTSAEEGQSAMDQLSKDVNFASLSEEYLDRLTSEPEVAFESPTWRLVQEAIIGRKTGAWENLKLLQREGLRSVRLRLVEYFSIDMLKHRRSVLPSPLEAWRGRRWRIEIESLQDKCPIRLMLTSCLARTSASPGSVK